MVSGFSRKFVDYLTSQYHPSTKTRLDSIGPNFLVMKAKFYVTFLFCMFSLTFLNAQEEEKGPDPQTTPGQSLSPPRSGNEKLTSNVPNGTEKNNGVNRNRTPFTGHIDVDLNNNIPAISVQNMSSSWPTYSAYFNDAGTYLGVGVSGSTSNPIDIAVNDFPFLTFNYGLSFTDGLGLSEIMRIETDEGHVGIGTGSPATNTKLHVVQKVDNPTANGIIYGQFDGPAASENDTPGVLGENAVDDFYGIGVEGHGGWRGVVGEVNPTGGNATRA